MSVDAALLDTTSEATPTSAPASTSSDQDPTPELEPELVPSARGATRGSPCARFAWGAAGSGAALFVAGLAEAAGTWALSAGAMSLTVASIAGVIAMEGCEERSPGSSPVPRRPRSRTS